jgi:hypothetical protein
VRRLTLAAAVVAAVVVRPRLWLVGLRQALLLAGRRWWARPPFLPLPPPAYLRFRMVTAYGGDGTGAEPARVADDVVSYLRWCREWHASAGAAPR